MTATRKERDILLTDEVEPRPSGGVAGARAGVKCLHAHYADTAAGNDNPVGAIVAPQDRATRLPDRLRGKRRAKPGMERTTMTVSTRRVAAVDIGTNSMRLLIVMENDDSWIELGRWERVTGLGRGVDADGVLNDEAVDRTLLALAEFGARMNDAKVSQRRAVATSAARDAANRDSFFDRAELALGVRPELITGEEEARLAFAGASDDSDQPILVVDIGGGSTELVDAKGATSVPNRFGSTDRSSARRATGCRRQS